MRNIISSFILKHKPLNKCLRFLHPIKIKYQLNKRQHIYLDPRDISGPSFYVAHTGEGAFYHYEIPVKAEILKFLPPNGTLIDIGANIGLISLFIAKFRPDAKVYAFEPSDTTYDCLFSTLSSWRVKTVTLIKKGISDKTINKANFYCDNRSSGGNSLEETAIKDVEKSIQIELTTLDTFIKENSLKPDVIKIDVQDHERFVLEGAWETINTFRPAIIIETNNNLLIEHFQSIFSKLYDYQVSAVGSHTFYSTDKWPELAKKSITEGYPTYDYLLVPNSK